MIFKSKIKWAALGGLILSLLSLLLHLLLAKYSSVDLVQYSAMTGFRQDFARNLERQSTRYRKLWGNVKPLESLQPYANPRTIYPAFPCLHALSATSTPAILRIPGSSATWAKKALDLGPQGIMLPMIKKAVSYCRFPPAGVHGSAYAVVRASNYGLNYGHLSNYEEELLIMCQVESEEGMKKIEEIVAGDGVDFKQIQLQLTLVKGQKWGTSQILAKLWVPNEHNNGFIYAKVFGGFESIRSSICDLVAISRLLNATLVIPDIQESTRSKGISSKFKSFSYLYNEDQFIAALMNDVLVVKSLPKSLKEARRRNVFPTFKPKSSTSPSFYLKEVLPKLKKGKVVGLVVTAGGCLQSILPPSFAEYQRLRCRVAFHALHFRPEIQVLGRRMVERLQAWNQPYITFHPGLMRDTLAYHGCAELFQVTFKTLMCAYRALLFCPGCMMFVLCPDIHTELIQYRRAQMIKQGVINDELSIDSHLQRGNGSCPLMPEEVHSPSE
ncbi:hypothetical protein GIB67_001669 [Kingdonia uniflora]|uniref:O-fucosyltransferase family protein n=1 Tax=Kingdonia uniflora TaxID=39325 RepID=A0A7J7L9C5_9MAGN|nr:hypothetical protein GIB67_001669 [Kingdonia uniflora]